VHFRHILFYEYKKVNNAAKIFAPHMVKGLFQNAHVGNGSQGSEKKISIYPMKVMQANLPTVMKKQSKILYRKMHDKVLRNYQKLRDSKVNGTLQFEEDGNSKSLRCLGIAYIDRKVLPD